MAVLQERSTNMAPDVPATSYLTERAACAGLEMH